jgi:hypothetical protein
MRMQIAAIGEEDIEDVSRFLQHTFSVGEDWVPFQPEVVRWKALKPHPLWTGSRGYALRRDGEIAAYGCAMPTRFRTKDSDVLVACVVDWSASRAMPGGGVAIYQHIGKLTDGLMGVGGSDDAHRVITRMGFQVRQHFEVGARVTRPWHRFFHTGFKSWRDVARLGRNTWRALQPLGLPTGEWRSRRVESFDESVAAVLPRPGLVSETICLRNAKILNYLLQCPAARMEGYVVERAGVLAGYFLLAFTRDECRIADLWVASGESNDWLSAVQLAAHERSGNQVSMGYGTDFVRHVARAGGFHLIVRQPVYVKNPKGSLPGALHATMGLSEMDAFFL